MSWDHRGLKQDTLEDRRFVRNLDWNLLKIFAEIVRSNGITNAAHALCRQQPAVSSALKRLEEYLDKELCRRGPGGFCLTDHGERLAAICEELEDLVFSLQPEFDEIDNDVSIQIRIVTVANMVSPRLDDTIARFGRRFPRSELLIKVAPCPDIETSVKNGEADIGVCPAPSFFDDLKYTLLSVERHVPVCGKRHALYGAQLTDRQDLVDEAFIIPGNDEAGHIRDFRERHGWGAKIAGQSLDLFEVRRMLLAGLGVALLPFDFVQYDLDRGALWALMPPLEELNNEVYLVTHRRGARAGAARKFVDLLPVW